MRMLLLAALALAGTAQAQPDEYDCYWVGQLALTIMLAKEHGVDEASAYKIAADSPVSIELTKRAYSLSATPEDFRTWAVLTCEQG